MTGLSSGLDAALASDRALVTIFIEAVLPASSATMRLCVGTGSIAWSGNSFADSDATFGALAAIDAIEDGEGDEAPTFGFTMLPPSDSAAASLCAPGNQGGAVRLWLAGIDPATGVLVDTPYLLNSLLIDQPILKIGKGSRAVDIECVDAFDRLLEEDEGARLSDAFHQSIWPGELGFINVTGIENDVYWGMARPAASTVTYGGSTGLYAGLLGGKHP